MSNVIHVDFKKKEPPKDNLAWERDFGSVATICLVIFAIAVLFGLSGCTTYPRILDVAQKSYQLGCVDRSNGTVTDTYTCYHKSKKFKKELDKEWRKRK